MNDKMVSQKRLTDRLTQYWERVRKDQPLPQMEKFHGDAVADIWDFCFTVRVENFGTAKDVYIYEYIGKGIVEAFGKDMTGRPITLEMQSVPGTSIIKKIGECVAHKDVVHEDGRFINDKSKVVKYRSCMLPFGKKDGTVSHVLVGLSWKAY